MAKAKNPDKVEIKLECTTGTSNKFYNLLLEKDNKDLWVLSSTYGRIGSKGRYQLINSWKAYVAAQQEMNKIKNQKLSKGYRVVEQNTISDKKIFERAQTDSSLQRFTDILME